MPRGTGRTSAYASRMNHSGKMLVPLLGVLAVLAMGVAGVAIYLQMQEHEKRQAKERELNIALAENEDLKTKVDDLQQTKARMEGDLAKAQKDLIQTKDELTKNIQAQEQLSRDVSDREREITRLSKELEQAKNASQQATAQLADLQNEREAIQQQLADLEKAKGELESKVTELSSTDRPTVQLDKVMVNANQPGDATVVPASTGTPAASTEGQVVVVNREYDFIVMNRGKNHGLSVGQEFQIVRGNQVLGKVKVEKVYDELSAAAILPDSQKDNIKEGDAVKAL